MRSAAAKRRPGNLWPVERGCEFAAVEPRRPEPLEWRIRSSPDAYICRFKQADAGIEQCGIEIANVRRRIRSTASRSDRISRERCQPSSFTTSRSAPSLAFVVVHAANSPIVIPYRTGNRCHAVNDSRPASSTGPSTIDSADRIRPIEDDQLDFVLGRRFEHEAERADVRVEPAADVLDVEDKRVDTGQRLGFRLAARPV